MSASEGRRPLIAANWKMHKTAAEAEAFIATLLPHLGGGSSVEVVICPSYLAVHAVIEHTWDSRVEVYAQNMHYADEGAFTGEVAPPMLAEAGVRGVIVGHSERREHFGETDAALERKVPAALAAGLTPLLCVGESEGERERDETEQKLRRQMQEDLGQVDDARLAEIVIAYEPIWAIGTGHVATPEQAQDAIAFVRAVVRERSQEGAENIRILYGGSVKPENAAELLALPDVDGALVGGASLDPADAGRQLAGRSQPHRDAPLSPVSGVRPGPPRRAFLFVEDGSDRA